MTTAAPDANLPLEAEENPATTIWTLEHLLSWCLVVGIVFVNAADFRGDSGADDFSVHWQIYLRLLVCFACGLVGALSLFPRTYREFLVWPGMLLPAYCGIFLLLLPLSIHVTYSLAAWVSLVGVILFLPAAMRSLGGRRFLQAVLAGLTTHLLGSWIAYLVFPDVGVFLEQVTRTEVFERMGGLAHPNELGFYAAFTVLLAAGMGVRRMLPAWIVCGVMLLGVATLYGCFSRTAMLACGVGLCFVLRRHLFTRGNVIGISLGGSLAMLVLFSVIGTGKFDWRVNEMLTKLTKSGSTDELATATGRTAIWGAAIGFIGESPLVGYGYCTPRFVMDEHSYHGHNMLLNAMLSGGVPAGLVVLCMILVQVGYLATRPCPEIDGLAGCMIFAGMMDGVLGAPSPSGFLVIWVTCLLWRQMRLGES